MGALFNEYSELVCEGVRYSLIGVLRLVGLDSIVQGVEGESNRGTTARYFALIPGCGFATTYLLLVFFNDLMYLAKSKRVPLGIVHRQRGLRFGHSQIPPLGR